MPVVDLLERSREGGRPLLCATCGHRVTSREARTEIDGRHEHERFNPHGYKFRFGCFAVAPGCVTRGLPTDEFTWFRGYLWQYDHCAGCGTHLGWRFESADHGFHGLVLDRLVDGDEEGRAGED
jgi:hypothetical protein